MKQNDLQLMCSIKWIGIYSNLYFHLGHTIVDPYDSVYVYRSACKRLRVVPSVSVCRQLPGGELCIDNYNIGERSIMAIALALVVSTIYYTKLTDINITMFDF